MESIHSISCRERPIHFSRVPTGLDFAALERFLLFIFLVLALPAFVFWAGNGMRPAGETWHNFSGQVGAVSQALRTSNADASRPEPEAEPEEKQDPEDPEPTEGPSPEAAAPAQPASTENADRSYREGRFDEAAELYARTDPERAAVARLAAVLSSAFPKQDFRGKYLRVTTLEGGKYEGFAERDGNNLRLTKPSGLSLALPEERIQSRKELTRQEALAPARALLQRGLSAGRSERRSLLPLVQSAFAMGEVELAGQLVERALELDRQDPFLIDALSQRVPSTYRGDALRAYQAMAGAAPAARPEPLMGKPRKLGSKPPRPAKGLVKDAEAKRILRTARKRHGQAGKLYDKITVAGLEQAEINDVEQAIRLIEDAITLYWQVIEIEDSNAVYALVKTAARQSANLRFWKTQLGAR